MPTLNSMTIIASTSRRRFAPSPMYVNFMIDDFFAEELQLPSTSHGDTKVMTFPASHFRRPVDTSEITPEKIMIATDMPGEKNAWLPQAMYVLADVGAGDLIPLASIPEWPTQMWLSADPADHRYPDAMEQFTLAQIMEAALP